MSREGEKQTSKKQRIDKWRKTNEGMWSDKEGKNKRKEEEWNDRKEEESKKRK